MGEVAAGHWSFLLQEISTDPRKAVGSEEETTTTPGQWRSRISS